MNEALKHPQIFSDLMTLFEHYYQLHGGMPKAFRISVGERILSEFSEGIRMIVLANAVNKKTADGCTKGASYIALLRGNLEVAHSFVLMGWKLRYISHGAMAIISEQFDGIMRQAAKWEHWFICQR